MKIKRIPALILSVLIMAISVIPAFAQEQTSSSGKTDFITELTEPDGRILGVSYRGDTKNFPENTQEGAVAAVETGIDAVLMDVRQMKDGTLIMFADDTTERMLDCDTVYEIAETNYSDIADIHLRNGSGGQYTSTEYTIPTLAAMLETAKGNGFSLVLSCETSILSAVTDEIIKAGMIDKVAVMVKDSAKNIEAALKDCEQTPVLIGTIRSNVIFSVTSFEDRLDSLGAAGVCLKTTNRYGVNFYKSHLSRLTGKLRAVADLSDTETAGWRADCEEWWDDLISRGYSVIITKEPALFAEYSERTDSMRETLTSAVKTAEAFPLPEYKTEIFNDYKKAYDDALTDANELINDKASSFNDMSVAYAALEKAVDDLNLNFDELEEGTAGLSITPKSICLCIFAVVLVLAAQIFVYKKKKK